MGGGITITGAGAYTGAGTYTGAPRTGAGATIGAIPMAGGATITGAGATTTGTLTGRPIPMLTETPAWETHAAPVVSAVIKSHFFIRGLDDARARVFGRRGNF